MLKFISAAPCFAVADVGATMRWYKSKLGFNGNAVPENEPFVFAILWLDGVEIMLQRIEGYQKPDVYHQRSGGVWDAYVRVNGVEKLYEAVKDKVQIKKALCRQPYGQIEFEVKDVNGYILVFSEPAA